MRGMGGRGTGEDGTLEGHTDTQTHNRHSASLAARSGGELPVELELPPTHRMHHSIFACPVSKEPTTPGNPPMLLPCGHVLALGSLTKLARGSRTVRFKCPYCPAEATTAMAKVLHL